MLNIELASIHDLLNHLVEPSPTSTERLCGVPAEYIDEYLSLSERNKMPFNEIILKDGSDWNGNIITNASYICIVGRKHVLANDYYVVQSLVHISTTIANAFRVLCFLQHDQDDHILENPNMRV